MVGSSCWWLEAQGPRDGNGTGRQSLALFKLHVSQVPRRGRSSQWLRGTSKPEVFRLSQEDSEDEADITSQTRPQGTHGTLGTPT